MLDFEGFNVLEVCYPLSNSGPVPLRPEGQLLHHPGEGGRGNCSRAHPLEYLSRMRQAGFEARLLETEETVVRDSFLGRLHCLGTSTYI